jgi:hypothetical protein
VQDGRVGLRKVTKILVTGELHSESVITFHVVHIYCHVMEELGSMCDGGDCWISPTIEIDGGGSRHPPG